MSVKLWGHFQMCKSRENNIRSFHIPTIQIEQLLRFCHIFFSFCLLCWSILKQIPDVIALHYYILQNTYLNNRNIFILFFNHKVIFTPSKLMVILGYICHLVQNQISPLFLFSWFVLIRVCMWYFIVLVLVSFLICSISLFPPVPLVPGTELVNWWPAVPSTRYSGLSCFLSQVPFRSFLYLLCSCKWKLMPDAG